MLIKKKEFYKYICPYCRKEHSTLQEAENCLDSHNIIFTVEKLEWELGCTGHNHRVHHPIKTYKHYKDVKAYENEKGYEIGILSLDMCDLMPTD